jgi:hypothetical protein
MSHDHDHDHHHGRVEGGSHCLVLDIGADIGALVIYADERLDEAEIEISPGTDPRTPRSHNQVHARTNRHGTAYTAVFPAVPAGDYTVWHHDGSAQGNITIHGGHVTEHHWY